MTGRQLNKTLSIEVQLLLAITLHKLITSLNKTTI